MILRALGSTHFIFNVIKNHYFCPSCATVRLQVDAVIGLFQLRYVRLLVQ